MSRSSYSLDRCRHSHLKRRLKGHGFLYEVSINTLLHGSNFTLKGTLKLEADNLPPMKLESKTLQQVPYVVLNKRMMYSIPHFMNILSYCGI